MLQRKLDKNAADFLDVIVFANHVLIAQDVTKAQLASFALGLGTSVERPIFSPQLLGGVAGHPKRFLVDHSASPRRISVTAVVFSIVAKGERDFPQPSLSNSGAAATAANLLLSLDLCRSFARFCKPLQPFSSVPGIVRRAS